MVIGCSSESKCDLAIGLKARSGGGATDCGHAVLGTDAALVFLDPNGYAIEMIDVTDRGCLQSEDADD